MRDCIVGVNYFGVACPFFAFVVEKAVGYCFLALWANGRHEDTYTVAYELALFLAGLYFFISDVVVSRPIVLYFDAGTIFVLFSDHAPFVTWTFFAVYKLCIAKALSLNA